MARRRPHLDPVGEILAPVPDPETSIAAAADRFAAAAAHDTGPEDAAEVRRSLREAPVQRLGRVVYSSNAVFLMELDAPDPTDPTAPMRAIYKPAAGERPLWDFPRHSLHFREVATHALDSALGFGLVPPTVLRDTPAGPGSAQLYVEHLESGQAPPAASEDEVEAALNRVATLDVLANNADRKRAHLLLSETGRIWAIDNALTFLGYPRQRTVLLDLGGSPLSDECRDAVTHLAADPASLATTLRLLLEEDEVVAALARIEELAEDPVYPELDPWDGRPWEGW